MAQSFTNTTDINGLSYNINHVQNKTNIQDPTQYDYAPGASIDIYNSLSEYLSPFVLFLVNTLDIIKKNIYNGYLQLKKTFEKLFQTFTEYSIYFIIIVLVIVLLYKFIYRGKSISPPIINNYIYTLKSV